MTLLLITSHYHLLCCFVGSRTALLIALFLFLQVSYDHQPFIYWYNIFSICIFKCIVISNRCVDWEMLMYLAKLNMILIFTLLPHLNYLLLTVFALHYLSNIQIVYKFLYIFIINFCGKWLLDIRACNSRVFLWITNFLSEIADFLTAYCFK